jgi:hypothetical protein
MRAEDTVCEGGGCVLYARMGVRTGSGLREARRRVRRNMIGLNHGIFALEDDKPIVQGISAPDFAQWIDAHFQM